jgi:hypothetical protein
MEADAEQKMLPLGPMLLKTTKAKDYEELIADLDNTVEQMKEDMPNLAGFFVFGVDMDRSVFSYVNVSPRAPHNALLWPELVRNACFMDLITTMGKSDE